MKWVVLAIIVCVVPYTWITLAYRKPTPAYQPYEDGKERANVRRLLDAGYQRVYIAALPPAAAQTAAAAALSGSGATPVDAPGGLTEELASTLVEPLPLPQSITSVSAASGFSKDQPYHLAFTCKTRRQKHPLSGAHLFIKEDTLVIVPAFVPPDVASNQKPTEEESAVLSIPPSTFKHASYSVLLIAAEASRQWTIDAR